jgi:ubiquinone/menaquinone biosynthesis C-methylase UbiE
MIETKQFNPQDVRHVYNNRSWIYSKTVAPMEWPYHRLALEQAAIKRGEKVLEVAVGPGLTFLELARQVGKETKIYGVDLSTKMLEMTTSRLRAYGYSKFELREADCRNLPFEDISFDVIYISYMLDLIPLADMPTILGEFKRVLRPGGRLVLLNMSKADETLTLREKIYQRLPANFVLYVLGGCRPVLMERPTQAAGFTNVQRSFLPGKAPSEIILARK